MAMLQAMGMCQGIVGLGKYLRDVDYVENIPDSSRYRYNLEKKKQAPSYCETTRRFCHTIPIYCPIKIFTVSTPTPNTS
jgi:hypothetical protein